MRRQAARYSPAQSRRSSLLGPFLARPRFPRGCPSHVSRPCPHTGERVPSARPSDNMLEGTRPHLSSHPTGKTNEMAGWITPSHGCQLPRGDRDTGGGKAASAEWTKLGDDALGVNVRPRTGLFPSLVVRGEPRQHGGQIGDVEILGTGELIAQTVVEQVGRIPGRPRFIECPTED